MQPRHAAAFADVARQPVDGAVVVAQVDLNLVQENAVKLFDLWILEVLQVVAEDRGERAGELAHELEREIPEWCRAVIEAAVVGEIQHQQFAWPLRSSQGL